MRVAAVLDRLDFDAWRAVLERVAPASDPGAEGAGADPGGGIAAVAEFALSTDELGVFGQTFKAVDLRARADPGGWKAHLESDRAEGEFDWREAGKGTLSARFRHLRLVRDASAVPPPARSSPRSMKRRKIRRSACPRSMWWPSASRSTSSTSVASRCSRATAAASGSSTASHSRTRMDGSPAGGSGAQASASARSSISASRPQRWGR